MSGRSVGVLIDTWWNVNEEYAYLDPKALNGFNRYMVECEFATFVSISKDNCVLIDTWWNVNLGQ